MPGVIDVFTGDDLPDVTIPIRMPWTETEEAHRALQPPLARDRVRYVGEPVAVVVAIDPYVAEDAAQQVWIEVDELDPVLNARRAEEQPVLHPAVGSNVLNRLSFGSGDVDRAFAAADVAVAETLRVHRHTAVPMETRGLLAEFDRTSEQLTVWGAAKVKHFNRSALAGMLGLRDEQVRLIEVDVGGGFGVRGEFYPEDFLIPFLAIRLGTPVKWVEDRSEHFVATNHSREADFDVEICASADGRLSAFRVTAWSSLGAYVRTHGVALPLLIAFHLPGPYRWDAFAVDSLAVMTNKTPAGTYRGPGIVEATFARERLLDRVATELSLDAIELRARNLVSADELPFRIDLGPGALPITYESGDYRGLWRDFLARINYSDLSRERRRRRERGESIGIGVAAFTEVSAVGPFEQARIVPEESGRFCVHVGVASVGQGVQTALSQIAADALGVKFENVDVSHHDTAVIPEGFGAFASRTTVLGGNAIVLAARDLLEKARSKAAHQFGVGADEVNIVDGAATSSHGDTVTLAALGCVGEGRYVKENPTWSFGASAALVRVDAQTGQVRVLQYFAGCDVGRVVNPMTVQGQIVGAAVQGVAGALLEELVYDDQGQPVATSFMDYLMPTLSEVPDIDVVLLGDPLNGDVTPTNPLGVKGAGEVGINGTAAAIANAVADAIGEPVGAEVLRLPLTANAIWSILRRRASSASDRTALDATKAATIGAR